MVKYYTLSDCALGNQNIEYLIGLIFKNEAKLALDTNSILVSKYLKAIDSQNKDETDTKRNNIVKAFFDYLSMNSSYAEFFIISQNYKDPFMDICSKTIDKCLLVGSIHKCSWSSKISYNRKYVYDSTEINILEIDEISKKESISSCTINNYGLFASNGSQINKSKIK